MKPNGNRKRPAAALTAVILVLAAAFSSGCKPRIAFNLDAIPDYVYECKSYSGGLNEKGEPSYTDIPGNIVHIKVSPLMKLEADSGDVKITFLTEDEKPDVYGNKSLGQVRIKLSENGIYTVTTSQGNAAGLTDIFFETPEKKLKKGDSWDTVRYQDESFFLYNRKFEFKKPVEYKYTYAGKETRDGERCARIKVKGQHIESTNMQTPDGEAIFTTSLTRTGDIYFALNPGRVQEAAYDQIIEFNAKDAYTGDPLVMINNMTRKVYKLIKK